MAQYRSDINKLDSGQVVTRYEVAMFSDRLSPSGTLTDAFGRLRTSSQYTLFDSFHRYKENPSWETATNGGGTIAHQPNESAVDLNIGTTSGAYVYRETKRVFSYQPGKSLLIMNTFVMNQAKTNLRQRIGFFNSQNGVYLENDGVTNYLVLRSFVTGAVQETRIAQANWNKDKFDGTGYASQGGVGPEHKAPIDFTKSNIFWIDIEWLGVGDVRCGFVVDGKMVIAHIFHNDNINTTTYMTTAILPLRYEIENTGTTASSSILKQICSTIQSEGGYQLNGRPRTIGMQLSSPKSIPTAGTFVPIISFRLKDAYPDAIAILKAASLFGTSNNTRYRYKIVTGGTLTAPSWVSVATESVVEYDISATAITGGVDRSQGYINVAAGAGGETQALRGDDLFQFQLERNPFAVSDKGYNISLVATGAANGDAALGHLTWEEIT